LEQHEDEGPAAVQGSPATVQLEPVGWAHLPLALHTPEQQAPGSPTEHAWPVWMHLPVLHEPLTQLSEQQSRATSQLAPAEAHTWPEEQRKVPVLSGSHRPVQHSTPLAHVWPTGLHAPPPSGDTLTHWPPEQTPEQHSAGEPHVFPVVRQLPPSGNVLPPSAGVVPPSFLTEPSGVSSGGLGSSSPQLQPDARQASTRPAAKT
jgi:hypothetical protein